MHSVRILASRAASTEVPLFCRLSSCLVSSSGSKTNDESAHTRKPMSIPSRSLTTTSWRCWAQPASSAFDDHAPLYADHNWQRAIPITEVDKEPEAKMVVVQWEDGDSQRYPNVWLKSNCHCDGCYSKGAHGKLKYTQHLDLDIQADHVSISQGGQALSIKWSDGHLTTVPSNWLRCNRFDQSDLDPVADAKLDLWGSDVMESGRLKTYQFDDIMQSDDVLLDWLSEIKVLGLALVKNAPKESHQIHKLADRVGYITPSTYGTHSDVIAVEDGDMLGFSNGYLQPHTDFSYYVSPPGVALFHCIKNTSTIGGDSLLIDGFKAAMELKTDDHEAFQMLTKHEIEHVAIAANKKITQQGFYHHARHPMVRLDALGQLKQITFNEIYHASLFRVPVDDVIPMFSAMKEFNRILLREDNVFKYKLRAGDIMTFNNHRMLHGRSAYTSDTGRVERHLQTCFVEWDCVLSKMRVLKKSVK